MRTNFLETSIYTGVQVSTHVRRLIELLHICIAACRIPRAAGIVAGNGSLAVAEIGGIVGEPGEPCQGSKDYRNERRLR